MHASNTEKQKCEGRGQRQHRPLETGRAAAGKASDRSPAAGKAELASLVPSEVKPDEGKYKGSLVIRVLLKLQLCFSIAAANSFTED